MKFVNLTTFLLVAWLAQGESRLHGRRRELDAAEDRDLQTVSGCIYITSADGTRRTVAPCTPRASQGAMEANVEEVEEDTKNSKKSKGAKGSPAFPNLVPDRVVVGTEDHSGPVMQSGTPSSGGTVSTTVTSPSSSGGTAMEANVPSTVLSVIESTPNLSRFYRLLLMSGLDTTLASDGPYTILAPTNGAFPLGNTNLNLDSKNPLVDLQNKLKYHILPGSLKAANLAGEVTTMEGATLTVSTMNGVTMVNGEAIVVTTDIIAPNGVVHFIDTMLVAPVEP